MFDNGGFPLLDFFTAFASGVVSAMIIIIKKKKKEVLALTYGWWV